MMSGSWRAGFAVAEEAGGETLSLVLLLDLLLDLFKTALSGGDAKPPAAGLAEGGRGEGCGGAETDIGGGVVSSPVGCTEHISQCRRGPEASPSKYR